MRKSWKAIVAAVTFIAAVGAALTYVSGWYKLLFPQPTAGIAASELAAVSSLNVNQIVPGSLEGYTFDVTGHQFDYRQPPARIGYLVQCKWNIAGRGAGDVYYAIEDTSTTPSRVITPLTEVGWKVNDVIGTPTDASSDFFAETGNLGAAARPEMSITVMITLAGSSVTQATTTLPLQNSAAAVAAR
ncbi:MAG TPA: hypothetical protein VGX91_13550 [Candidatus Cybelea sp.]|jgi:hypothetical protein|nr:hypothetical protein [Candidatus Cybelea sp.]